MKCELKIGIGGRDKVRTWQAMHRIFYLLEAKAKEKATLFLDSATVKVKMVDLKSLILYFESFVYFLFFFF